MRGLKPPADVAGPIMGSRIFYRCVDWNLLLCLTLISVIGSHLLQMRGLKLLPLSRFFMLIGRIFYRCVDWNLIVLPLYSIIAVASFTDAWIETQRDAITYCYRKSHLLQMRGLKRILPVLLPMEKCRIFYRCVDWNFRLNQQIKDMSCRIFYRCVDWNA